MIDTISRLVFPPRCVACKCLLPLKSGELCTTCLAEYVQEKEKQCPRCVQPMHQCTCNSRFLIGRSLPTLTKLYRYLPDSPELSTSKMIFRLKRAGAESVAAFLAKEMAESIRRVLEEGKSYVIVGVPRSKSSIRKYGYDHVSLLTKHLSRELSIPVVIAVERHGKDGEQKKKNRRERMQAAARSFLPASDVRLKGKSVILVDDVVTSGATLATCANAVRVLGARGVICAVVASGFRYGSIAERKVYESVRHEIMRRSLIRYYR